MVALNDEADQAPPTQHEDEVPGVSASAGLAQLGRLLQAGQRCIRLHGCSGAFQALTIARIAEGLPAKGHPLIAVVRDEDAAQALARDLQFFLGNSAEDPAATPRVLHLPGLDVSPYADASPDRRAILRRLGVLFRLSQGGDLSGQVLVTSVLGLCRRVVPRASFAELVDILQVEQEIDRERTIALLAQGGYTRMPVCEDPGTFAVRGGVLDLFVPLYRFPVRLELYGDLIESMRFYDPATQRTLRALDEIFIHPVRETVLTSGHNLRERILEAGDLSNHPSSSTRHVLERIESGEDFFGIEALTPAFHRQMASIAEYLPARPTFFLSEPHLLQDALLDELIANETAYERRLADRRLAFPPADFYLNGDELAALVQAPEATRIEAEALTVVGDKDAAPPGNDGGGGDGGAPAPEPGPAALDAGEPDVRFCTRDHLQLQAELRRSRAERHEHLLEPLVARLRGHGQEGVRVVMVCLSLQHAERLESMLKGYGLRPLLHRPGVASLAAEQAGGEALHRFDLLDGKHPGRLEIRVGSLHRGFDLPLDGVSLYCEAEIFGEKAVRRASKSQRSKTGGTGDFKDLEVGAFVVHQVHGVGIYRGLAKLPVRGAQVDFMHLEYEGGALYLPVWRLNEVGRYVGAEGVKPRLDKLGGETWQRTKAKVSREVRQMAEELLQLYAQRQALPGTSYHLDTDTEQLFQEFEATFPFEETPDQQRAIDDVLADMDQERPMDRLVCGDVGYGKTEVAMRAAMKAALFGKQVAVLAPTTVLVEQHAATFAERFKDMPVRVASLSRFRSRAEQTQVIKGLAEGGVDVVVGTHRLLSSDVRFKDLGLLIIDEEQRFGVAHKERLKQLRTQIDTLTLTATPIPRTLHMAMSGMREISIISTAPADRLAIRTIVARESDDLIREGVKKELARGGQVFFVHNRVETIGKWARHLHELLPGVRVLVGHGQMPPEELERVMLDFVDGKAEILLCTTIIESGLDIPRANTMFVDRADTFGLSQLYQLRGRIGRSRERAYCYLLVPPPEKMTGEAKQRLQVLQRFSDLGAGFSIATHDLEIRGAGDLLGNKQSGTIAAVGFEMYTQMLSEAVAELKGQPLRPERDPEMTCDLPGFIPDDYLPDTGQRLDFYKRLSSAHNEEEVAALAGELRDRYGTPPEEVEVLCGIAVVKSLGRRLGAQAIELSETRLALSLAEDTVLEPAQVLKLVNAPKSPWRLTPDMRLLRTWQGDKEKADRLLLAKGLLGDLLSQAGSRRGSA
jgi:transcription-repair coupling factor (superfamily II helicase)